MYKVYFRCDEFAENRTYEVIRVWEYTNNRKQRFVIDVMFELYSFDWFQFTVQSFVLVHKNIFESRND